MSPSVRGARTEGALVELEAALGVGEGLGEAPGDQLDVGPVGRELGVELEPELGVALAQGLAQALPVAGAGGVEALVRVEVDEPAERVEGERVVGEGDRGPGRVGEAGLGLVELAAELGERALNHAQLGPQPAIAERLDLGRER